ncbi:MAG: hypothetical protein ACK4S2_13905 [Gemmobacter sp.]|uniref:hypothetical protein n=1 Tax=Gemmobacter sp. TaxID=1898957 RepID=UPI00391A9C14
MMRRAVLILGVALAVAGCSTLDRVNPFKRKDAAEASLPYRAALRADRDGALTVTVKAPGATVDMVRESVRYPVTRYCLLERGSSDADWVTDPATGDWAYTATPQGDLTFQARCRA